MIFILLLSSLNILSAFTIGFAGESAFYSNFDSPVKGGTGFYINFTPEKDAFHKYSTQAIWKEINPEVESFELNNYMGIKLLDIFAGLSVLGGGSAGIRFIEEKQLLLYGVFLAIENYRDKIEIGSLGFGFRMLNDYSNFYGYEFTFMLTYRFF